MNDAQILSATLSTTHTAPTLKQIAPELNLSPERIFTDLSGVFNAKKLDNFIEGVQVGIASHVSDTLQSGLVFPWTQEVGTINVLTGAAKPAVNADSDNIATFNLLQTDFDIEIDVWASNFSREGIVVRYEGPADFVCLTMRGAGVNQLQLQTVNGASNVVGSYTNAGIAGGTLHRLRLVSVGNSFTAFLDGIQRIGPTVIAQNAGATKAGVVLRASGTNTGCIALQAR